MKHPRLGVATVVRADARTLPLPDNSVDLVVTSPPYFALRSYQDGGQHYDGQIGAEPTPDAFVSSLLEVTAECVRVLKPCGSLWVNLGDKYASYEGNRGAGNLQDNGPRPVTPGGAGLTGGGVVRAKSLVGIPWRYALRCIDELGLILRAEVIWSKPNGLPESVTDRVRRSHEQWFHFTLQPRYFSAVDEIREAYCEDWGSIYRNRGRRNVNPDGSPAGGNTTTGTQLGKLPGSVWTVPTEPLRVPDHLGVDHFAAFPTEWPKRIIQGWAPTQGVCTACGGGRRPVVTRHHERPAGDWNPDRNVENRPVSLARPSSEVTVDGYACACPEPTAPTTRAVVLDPFGGTGTTAMVAKALGCHGVTVDYSADYCRIGQWRTNDRDQLAKVLGVAKAKDRPQPPEQLDLFALNDEGATGGA